MYVRILTGILFLAIMGLLIAQRFSLPSELPVRIAAGSGEDAGYGFGEELRRGSVVETGNGFLKLTIGVEGEKNDQAETILWLAPNTRIELHRLYQDELTIRFTKGRLVVSNQAEVPLKIETNHTTHLVHGDVASFVNYDFLETVHVIPIKGSVQVNMPSGENLLTPVPLSIHETEPVTFEKLEVNLSAGDSEEFYLWTGILTEN
ncbi:MAG: hypothetical protein UY76_C0058G0003 [Candidatus Uhrbacteria bacterium GW2011_GWA2_52_8d]|uniref:FecR protein domain-containing protein n=1 Tax=Candidatus Uhrbacteria bacterium GW2011_GWA2_52_8d TaxID=1618979 RepID=A0A0G1XKK0_9BACT|nr:MAG: hypothetical protein UY76_C0058G0003 [Candidatus Uhrbacteria bacterium GW2011_GWA2_52_8d]